MVLQHTINTRQAQIKLKVVQLQLFQQHHLHMYKETLMVLQHTINTRQAQIKLKVVQLQLFKQTYYRETLILHKELLEVHKLTLQILEVMVSL